MKTYIKTYLIFAITMSLSLAACSDDGATGTVDAAGPIDAQPSADAPPPPPPSCPLSNPDDPLCAVNNSFRSAYAQARDETIATVDPVIVSIFDRVILLRAGQREEVSTIGDRYHELKSMSHVPLGVYVSLVNHTDQALDAAITDALSSFQGLVSDARASLDGRGFTPEQQARQERLLDGSSTFIDQVLTDGMVSASALDAFAAGTTADIDVNAREAAESQLEATHTAVTAWLNDMTPDEIARLRIVVANGHMPREGSLPSQYFTAVVGDPYEGKFDDENIIAEPRMIAAEGIYSETGLLNLLGTHLLDGNIGVSFFADPVRMHRDLLADATEDWIAAELGITPMP